MSDAGRNSAASSAVADLSGRQVGDLRLLRRLGRGAMAEVYLAEQLRLKRRVAVKILKPALAEDHTYLKHFDARRRRPPRWSTPTSCRSTRWVTPKGCTISCRNTSPG